MFCSRLHFSFASLALFCFFTRNQFESTSFALHPSINIIGSIIVRCAFSLRNGSRFLSTFYLRHRNSHDSAREVINLFGSPIVCFEEDFFWGLFFMLPRTHHDPTSDGDQVRSIRRIFFSHFVGEKMLNGCQNGLCVYRIR